VGGGELPWNVTSSAMAKWFPPPGAPSRSTTGLRLLADVGLELDPVPEKPIDLTVSVIEEPVVPPPAALELEDRAIGQSELVALSAD